MAARAADGLGRTEVMGMGDQKADQRLIDVTDIDLRQLLDADDPELLSALDLVLAHQPDEAHNRFNSKI